MPRSFRSGTSGCGNPVYSAFSAIGRTTKVALGFYDFEDDSGLHFFPGIAANCGARIKAVNMTAALGLLLFSEARSHCNCMVPIRTSLAFAPAERRLNEDWALFSERDADAPVRRASINFGAPGDRRDSAGTLWLGHPRRPGTKVYPRPPGSRDYLIEAPPIPGLLQLPLQMERERSAAPYTIRVNADRVGIDGTDRPWIYASAARGTRKLVLQLHPAAPLASRPLNGPVTLDGVLGEADWTGEDAHLDFTGTAVSLRHDRDTLYIGARRPAAIDRLGASVPWAATTKGEDADIHRDDAWEVFISDSEEEHVLHLGLAASGARYDALATGDGREVVSWAGAWTGAVATNEKSFTAELAVPFRVLTGAGIDTNRLGINFQASRRDLRNVAPLFPHVVADTERGIRESLLSLGPEGCARCANFVPLGLGEAPQVDARPFTVRLHFAELGNAEPGIRVFDVSIQGETVLKDFDIAQAAGGPFRAVMREFKNVSARETLTVEFHVPQGRWTPATAPIISALELHTP